MIKYQDGYKYQLVEGHEHTLPLDFVERGNVSNQFLSLTNEGILTIRKGYSWDGASGPTVDTKSFMRGSLIHDACYQLMREGLIPKDLKDAADRELQRICIEDGMWKIRAWWVYRGVKRFGAGATIHNKNIMVAP